MTLWMCFVSLRRICRSLTATRLASWMPPMRSNGYVQRLYGLVRSCIRLETRLAVADAIAVVAGIITGWFIVFGFRRG